MGPSRRVAHSGFLVRTLGQESVEARFSEHSAELAEGEEGHERDENDDGARGELFQIEPLKSGSCGVVMDEAFDELLDEVEKEDEDAE